jgi:hypothetical protein
VTSERPSMRQDTTPAPTSSSRMPRIERMGRAAERARTTRAHGRRRREVGVRDELCGGECGAGSARPASSARLMPLRKRILTHRKKHRENAVDLQLPRTAWCGGVAKTPRGKLMFDDRSQHALRGSFGRSKFGRSNRGASVTSGVTHVGEAPRDGRAFPCESTGACGQVYAGERGDRFGEHRGEFQQKIIWVVPTSRVQFW